MINAIKLRNITLSIFGALLLIGGLIKGSLWLHYFFHTAPVDQIANFWLAFWFILLVEQIVASLIFLSILINDHDKKYYGTNNFKSLESKNYCDFIKWSNVHTINDLIIFMLLWSSIGHSVGCLINNLYKLGQIKIK
jgi:hypothetical protein